MVTQPRQNSNDGHFQFGAQPWMVLKGTRWDKSKSMAAPFAAAMLLLITRLRWSLGLDDARCEEDEQLLFPDRFRLVFEQPA